ncbi:N-acetylmuramic acid 6-phosphate etherase [Bacillus subtilis]|nr:N-acetylmuramic acid 6-phosphate etherase [Bacillus subtilis]
MSEPLNLHRLTTESRNSQTVEIHKANTLGILKMINNEDMKVAAAVQEVLPDIKTAVDCAYESFQNGGRLIYTGAGTSGRLGVMDAVECPPTYSVSPDQVIGIMAGGPRSLFYRQQRALKTVEEAGAEDLKKHTAHFK